MHPKQALCMLKMSPCALERVEAEVMIFVVGLLMPLQQCKGLYH